jgi:hypothetical protein
MSGRSFADPDTHFALPTRRPGEPTGEVVCCECGQSAGAPEYIPHADGCPQADVTSRYYDDLH